MIGCGCLCVLWLLASTIAAATDGNTPTEYQVKAAMLYKFLSYIDWPPQAFSSENSPFRIWVLDAHHVEDELRRITADRTVNNRPIDVFHTNNIESIADPHLVFISHRARHYLPPVTKLAKRHSFLIVTESNDGLEQGSIINLRLVDGRIGFDVSLPNAQEYNLKLSARLLSVASSVKQRDH